MARLLAAIVLVAAVAAAAAAPPRFLRDVPGLGDPYTAQALMELPYAGIAEPIRIFYDAKNQRSRTEYYGGADVYIYLGKSNEYYQLVPESVTLSTSALACFNIKGDTSDPVQPQTLLPNFGDFEYARSDVKRGLPVDVYTYNFAVESKQNNYTFYINSVTKSPVELDMFGADVLLGSHYDHYIISYLDFQFNVTLKDELFTPPKNLSCGGFPGPGVAGHGRGALLMLEDPVREEQEVNKAFEEHKKTYGRDFSGTEHAQRHMNFRHNKRFVESTNRRSLSYKVALNHMADYHDWEFKAMRGSRTSRPAAPMKPETKERAAARPDSVDWRQKGLVTAVKDQGICGSCWSFGSSEAVEGQYARKTGQLVRMSAQALMDCSWQYGNNACDGGEAFRAYEWIKAFGYIPTEASYGIYRMADGSCHVKDADVGAKLKSYVNVTSGDIDTVLDTLAEHGPLAVAIDASHKGFGFYSSGVYYDEACGNTPDALDHAVLAVGYGTEDGEDYWIIKNSWSEYYGDQGYIKMSRRNNNCGVATDAHLPVLE